MSTYNKTVFDPSKFTYVGNPEVTKDGIASGFSIDNYIKTNNIIDFNKLESWEISLKVNISQYGGTAFWINDENKNINNNQCYLGVPNGGLNSKKIMWNLYYAPSGAVAGRLFSWVSPFEIQLDTDYFIKFKFDGSKYIFSYSTDGKKFNDYVAKTSSIKCGAKGNFQLGARLRTFPLQGSIDLKQFSITTGGGDVYNPDAFTLVGSPTITDDGIASGFSGSDYLKIKGSDVPTAIKNQMFIMKVRPLRPLENNFSCFIGGNKTYNGISMLFNTTKLLIRCSTDGTYYDIAFTLPWNIWDTEVYFKHKWDGVQHVFSYSLNGYNWSELAKKQSSLPLYIGDEIRIGQSATWAPYGFTGSIDLKQFSISVDGEKVFKGTKYIPLEEVFIGTKVIVCFYPILNDIEHLPKIVTDILGIDDILLAIDPEVQQTRVDISDLIKELYIKTTDKFIRRWELDFSLPYDASLTLQQRRQRVLNKLARKKTLTWENLKLLIQNNVDNPQFYIINDSGNYHLTIMVQTNNYKSLESALDNTMPAYLTYDIVVTEYFKRCGSFICGTNPL